MKKILILSLFSILAIMIFPAAALALPQSSVVGGGVFVMEHEDGLHRHMFGFNVKNPDSPEGTLHLVCMHDNELCMIVQSIEITSFTITDDSTAVFEGTAKVRMAGENWQEGWTFTVTALDNDKQGKGNDQFILELSNSEDHHMEGVLTSGNIVIKN